MNDEWITTRLDEICSIIKRGITPKYTDLKGISVINQRCIRDQKISFENSRKHNLQKKTVPEEKKLKSFDVLINSTGVGTLGRVAQIGEVSESVTVDSHVTIVRLDDKRIHPYFFGLALRHKEKFFELLGEGSTGQTELSRQRVGEVKISFPKKNPSKKRLPGSSGNSTTRSNSTGK